MPQYEFDAAGRLIVERDDIGRVRVRNTYNDRGQLVGYEREGIEYFPHAAGQLLLTGRSATLDDADQSQELAPAIAAALARLVRTPGQATAVRNAVLELDGIQLARVQHTLAHAQTQPYVGVLELPDLKFLLGPAQPMLPGDSPLRPHLYQSGNRWLMLCTHPDDTTPERRAMVDRILAHGRVQRQLPSTVVLSLSDRVDSIRTLAADQVLDVELPALRSGWDALRSRIPLLPPPAPRSAGRLAVSHPRRLGRAWLGQGIAPVSWPLLVLEGELDRVNVQAALPQNVVWRAYGADPDHLAGRINFQRNMTLLTTDAVLVNGVPASADEMATIGRTGENFRPWRRIRNEWGKLASKRHVTSSPGVLRGLIDALIGNPLVIIAFAASTSRALLLPDGCSFSPLDLDRQTATALRDNSPIVYLLASGQDSLSAPQALVRSLLDSGARGVIAPSTPLSVGTTRRIFDRFLAGVQRRQPFMEALWGATHGTDVYYWIGGSPE